MSTAPAGASLYDEGWLGFNEATGGAAGLGGDLGPDSFGHTLARGDFDGDGRLDLAVGHPYDTIGGEYFAGAATVIQGAASGWLDISDNWLLHHGLPGVPADASYSGLGYALAAGDLDRDGYDDLAVGAPYGERRGKGTAGSVTVFFGSPNGFHDPLVLDQDSSAVAGKVEGGNMFGFSLAIGRLNYAHDAELIVGAVGNTVAGSTAAGSVVVIGFNERKPQVSRQLYRGGGGLAGEAGKDDAVGAALAVGRVTADGLADLAIGAPGAHGHSGRVFVVPGSPAFFSAAPDAAVYTQSMAGGAREPGDHFGHSLAMGDFDGNGRDDLAVGASGEEVWGRDDAGAVNVFYHGHSSGWTLISGQQWHQGQEQVGGDHDAGDVFGASLAAGDLDGDGRDDLAVGAPGTDVTEGGQNVPTSGAVVPLIDLDQGLGSMTSWQIDRPDPGVPGVAHENEGFGSAIAIGHLDGDGRAELIIGTPYSRIGGQNRAGDVIVL